jgi:hypothetical protein
MTANRERSGAKLLKGPSRFLNNILFAYQRIPFVVSRVSDSLLGGGVAYVQEARHFPRCHGPVRLGSGSFVRLWTERGVRSFERDAQSGRVRAVPAVEGAALVFHGAECGDGEDLLAGIRKANGNAADAMAVWRANVKANEEKYFLVNVYGGLTDEKVRALFAGPCVCVRA